MKSVFNPKLAIAITITVVFALALFFLLKKEKTPEVTDQTAQATEALSVDEEHISVPGVAEVEVKQVDQNRNRFYHPEHRFSLVYLSDMKVTNFFEGFGEQILFQDESGDRWFQIYITSWDEGNNLSVDRILQDLPDLVIDEPQTAILGPKREAGVGINVLIFFGYEEGIGDTREVWFVRGGNLYQITTYKRLDSMLVQILSTLEFRI
jgi:hypothetical protein